MQLLAADGQFVGFQLWGLELISPNRRPTLRVYIEGETRGDRGRLRTGESSRQLGVGC